MIGIADRPDGIRVDRLVLRSPGLEAGVARLRAEHVLGAADLRPAGLPPHAILLVRRIRDPAPRRLALDRGTHVPARDWEAALRSRLADLYRRAARPARGAVGSDADAVAFADEAELLAAYAADVLDGRAAEAWWWRTAFGARAASASRLGQVLASAPTTVPAVVDTLERRGTARSLLLRLDEPATWRIVRAVAEAFGVGSVATELSDAAPGLPPASAVTARPPHARRVGLDPREDGSPPAGPSGAAASPPLRWHGHVLLELARALRRNPAGLGGSSFVRHVQATFSAVPEGRGSSPSDTASSPSLPVAPSIPSSEAGRQAATGSADPDRPAVTVASPRAVGTRGARATAGRRGGEPARRQGRTPGRGDAGRSDGAIVADAVGDPPSAVGVLVPTARGQGQAPAAEASAGVALPVDPAPVPTRLAGALCLVNVMVMLDLPGAFEADWRLASRCGAWGTLELLARGLLAGRPGHAGDGIWRALAGLGAVGQGRAAGDRLVRPAAGAAPPSWPPIGDADRSRRHVRATGLCRGLSPGARSWLTLVLPHVRRLVDDAFGTPGDSEALAEMLVRPGRLRVTDTHVDVEMALTDISVPVRRAGLDRDPGWQPAFGRTIRLHYE